MDNHHLIRCADENLPLIPPVPTVVGNTGNPGFQVEVPVIVRSGRIPGMFQLQVTQRLIGLRSSGEHFRIDQLLRLFVFPGKYHFSYPLQMTERVVVLRIPGISGP
ncbi:hypothetical protein D1872_270000 [compost metagenome]